jgi:hypothetical protein
MSISFPSLPSKKETEEWFARLRTILFGMFEALLFILAMVAVVVFAWEHTRAVFNPAQNPIPIPLGTSAVFRLSADQLMKPNNDVSVHLPQRDKQGRFLPGVCGCPEKKLKPGHPHRYQPGQSGNPAGVSQRRAQFEREFYGALVGQGTPDEAARLLWECARSKEPWAVQLLLQRIAPQESKFKLEVSRGQDEFDFGKLSDAELEALERIMERARPVAAIEGGESAAQAPDVH